MVSQNGTKSASVRAVIKVLRPCSSELKFNFVLTLNLSPGDRFYHRWCRHHRHGGRQQSWRCPQRHPALGNCCCVPILSPWSFIYRSTRCSAWPTANGWCHRRGQGGCHGSWPSIREFCYVGHRYAGGEFSVSGSGGLGSERCPAVSVCVAQFGQFVFCRSRASTAALIPDAFPVVSFACSARVQRSVGVRELFLGPGGGLFREVARSPQSAAT